MMSRYAAQLPMGGEHQAVRHPFPCSPYTAPWLFILADFRVKQPFALLAEQLFLRLYLTS